MKENYIPRVLRKLLVETQNQYTIDFDKKKQYIVNSITQYISNGDPKTLKGLFYDVITNNEMNTLGKAQTLGFTPEESKAWRKYLTQPPFNSDGGGPWSQLDINKDKYPKPNQNNRTYNFYISIEKTKKNFLQFLKSITPLYNDLSKISEAKKTPISFKMHNFIDNAIQHNDSLKVYYYDPSLKNEIEGVVKNWASKNNVSTSQRLFDHGVDKKEGEKQSYSQVLSGVLEKQLIVAINKNKNTYTPEQYFKWIKNYGPQIIQNVQIGN